MPANLEPLISQLRRDEPAILVTVAAVRGSAPREAGASMLVSAEHCQGTIGGGHLELKAIAQARSMLAVAESSSCLQRFPLGASLGQCCGGVVKLLFQPLDQRSLDWLATAGDWQRRGLPYVQVSKVGAQNATVTLLAEQRSFGSVPNSVRSAALSLLQGGRQTGAVLIADETGDDWLLHIEQPPELHIALFGAGHVGRAIVQALGNLPCRVSWVDSREEEFLTAPPANTQIILNDAPEDSVRPMPADSVFLVLTHDHALDLILTERILKRGDFRFFGLIGSQSKRRSFEQRLRHRGYADEQLSRMHCPIGVPGVLGKEPEVIAIAVAAQMMQLRRSHDAQPQRTVRAKAQALAATV